MKVVILDPGETYYMSRTAEDLLQVHRDQVINIFEDDESITEMYWYGKTVEMVRSAAHEHFGERLYLLLTNDGKYIIANERAFTPVKKCVTL